MSKQVEKSGLRTTLKVLKKIGIAFLFTLKWCLILVIVCGFIGGGAGLGYVASLVKDDEVRDVRTMMEKMESNSQTGFVYFSDGTVVGQLRTEEDRRMAKLDEIPQIMIDATLSIEDHRFNEHVGVDIKALSRAVIQKILNKPVQTGGSTITQQLARRVYLTLDREESRKAREIFLSLRLERVMSKDQILLAYLNKIPYGTGSTGYNLYGIKAASKGIFDINELDELNIAQAAFLAGLPQQPSVFSSFTSKGKFDEKGFSKAIERQQLVLRRMLEEEKITQEEYEAALAFDLRGSLAEPGQKAYNTYPYLMMETERQATNLLMKQLHPDLTADPKKDPAAYNAALQDVTSQMLYGGYHIHTTIDKTLYDAMQEIARDEENFTPDHPEKGVEQIGAVLLDNKTNAILGMIEGRDFFLEQLNHATQMTRQPGSTMKPIAAYIPALEEGLIQPGQVIDDIPILLPDWTKKYHIPNNHNNRFHGLITARTALNQSYNIPAIKLFVNEVGIEKAWSYAKKMGITTITESDYQALTGVIGGMQVGVTVKELTNAFATIPNGGEYKEAYMIEKITDANGKIIYEHDLNPVRVYSEETAYLMTDMLRTVVSSGTGGEVSRTFNHYKDIPVSGKTGSTQFDGDAWFMGFSPDITLGVWAGYEKQAHSLERGSGTLRAMRIWSLVMDTAYELKPELFVTEKFQKPETIVDYTVSGFSGKIPNDLTKQMNRLVTDIFNKKYIPDEEEDALEWMNVITYDGKDYVPLPTTPLDMTERKIVVKREKTMKQLLDEIAEAHEVMNPSDRKSLSYYLPRDADLDYPTEIDPREDQGQIPQSPVNISIARSESGHVLTFQTPDETNVVGYRLYRSVGGGPFQRVQGQIVLRAQEKKFIETGEANQATAYYITAVDIVGNESNPSRVIYSDGSSIDPFLPNLNLPIIDGIPARQENLLFPPEAPTGLKFTKRGDGLIVSWNENPTADRTKQYNIYYSEDGSEPFIKLGTAENNTQFNYYAMDYSGYYRVTAVNAIGESEFSRSVQYDDKDKDDNE